MPSLTARADRSGGPADRRRDQVRLEAAARPRLVLPSGLKLDRGARLAVLSTSRAPLDGSAPTFESKGVLSNFAIHFAGWSRCSSMRSTFVARAGRKLELDATGVGLTFEGELAFVEHIRHFIPPQGFSDPPSVAVSPTGSAAGYSLGLPGSGSVCSASRTSACPRPCELPFVDGPTRLRFDLSERHDPFLVTVSLFGGGGFLAITVDSEGTVGVEAALEFGGNFCLDLMSPAAECT